MEEIKNTTIGDIQYEGACAENIGAAIERIVNKYDFDKTKIKSMSIYINLNFILNIKFILLLKSRSL